MLAQRYAMKIMLAAVSIASVVSAEIGIKTNDSTISLRLNVDGWLQTGQMKSWYLESSPIPNQWLQQDFLDLGFAAIFDKRIRIVGGIEGEMWEDVPWNGPLGPVIFAFQYNSTFIVDNAYGSYSFGDTGAPYLSITAGRFRYKYDQDVRNLGEYLFRSGTYPAYLITNFDESFARLTGLKISSDLFGKLHQDIILSCSTDLPPYYDMSVSYIGNYDVAKFLNVGWGVQFANLFSVDPSQTTPKVSQDIYAINGADTSYYTFAGTKLMARFSFDPKPFIPTDIFGKEDCKLYAEAAILGLENYPANDSFSGTANGYTTHNENPWGYNTLAQKIPVVVGFDFPTFKLLDVLSTEVEWYGCKYPDSYAYEIGDNTAYGVPVPPAYDRDPYPYDNWKWSVYAKKTFANDHFAVIVQCARDHTRMQSESAYTEVDEYEEAMTGPTQWYWMTKLEARF